MKWVVVLKCRADLDADTQEAAQFMANNLEIVAPPTPPFGVHVSLRISDYQARVYPRHEKTDSTG